MTAEPKFGPESAWPRPRPASRKLQNGTVTCDYEFAELSDGLAVHLGGRLKPVLLGRAAPTLTLEVELVGADSDLLFHHGRNYNFLCFLWLCRSSNRPNHFRAIVGFGGRFTGTLIGGRAIGIPRCFRHCFVHSSYSMVRNGPTPSSWSLPFACFHHTGCCCSFVHVGAIFFKI